MGFLDLVKQNNRIGIAAHLLGQLTALLMAHVSRRGTDELGHTVFLHVLRHINPDHGLLSSKQHLCQCFGQFGLAHAGRPQE